MSPLALAERALREMQGMAVELGQGHADVPVREVRTAVGGSAEQRWVPPRRACRKDPARAYLDGLPDAADRPRVTRQVVAELPR